MTKLNVAENFEVGPIAVMMAAARGGSKEKWELYVCAAFHMPHTHAGMAEYKKVFSWTAFEVADGNILPVDGLGTIEVNLD